MNKVSVITVSYNCESTIEDTILSVASQDYPQIEHIIIDGGSEDKTVEIIQKHLSKIKHFTSEPDEGIYDAMNKGIRHATGDVIGILNADDVYTDNSCLSSVMESFSTNDVSVVCANLVYVSNRNLNRIVRFYDSTGFKPAMFALGMMPAHPATFILRDCYVAYGCYRRDYRIAADFELLLRFLCIEKLPYSCLAKVIVKMRMGGVSTKGLKSNWTLNREIMKACRENGIQTNFLKILSKYFIKVTQLFRRKIKD